MPLTENIDMGRLGIQNQSIKENIKEETNEQ